MWYCSWSMICRLNISWNKVAIVPKVVCHFIFYKYIMSEAILEYTLLHLQISMRNTKATRDTAMAHPHQWKITELWCYEPSPNHCKFFCEMWVGILERIWSFWLPFLHILFKWGSNESLLSTVMPNGLTFFSWLMMLHLAFICTKLSVVNITWDLVLLL